MNTLSHLIKTKLTTIFKSDEKERINNANISYGAPIHACVCKYVRTTVRGYYCNVVRLFSYIHYRYST